jgi:hypothetical protein
MAVILREYGVATTITFPMIKRDAVDFAISTDWTPAAGDTKISKDEGADANTTNNPAIVAGTKWKLALTEAEMQASRITINIVDSATKAVEDQCLVIETYGHASAQHPTLPASLDWSADVTNPPTIGTSVLTTGDIDARLAAWGKTGFSLSQTTGWGGSALPTVGTSTLDAAGVRSAVGLASANLDTQLGDIPTNAEFEARSLPAADYFVVGDYTAPPSAATVSTQVASDLATAHGNGSWATATSVTVSDKTGFKLASDGLDSISTTAPSGAIATWNFRERLMMVFRRLFGKATMTASELKTYASDGTTVLSTQSLTDDNTTQTQGEAS